MVRRMQRIERRALPAVLAAAALLVAGGARSASERPWLGVLLGDAVDGGVQLVAVAAGGPGDRGGLRPGDVLVHAGDRAITAVSDLERVLAGLEPGDALVLDLLRVGESQRVRIELGEEVAWGPGRWAVVAPDPPPPPASPCGRYGLCVTEVTPDLRRHFGAPAEAGVLVTGVVPGLPAAGSGVEVGDVLVRLGEAQVARGEQVEALLETAGDEVAAVLVRGQRRVVVRLRAAAGPLPRATLEAERFGAQRAIEEEIERLRVRLRELERRLERIRQEP